MAAFKLTSFAVLTVGLFLMAFAQEEFEDQGCPPGAPWCQVWVPCNYTEVQGPTCKDCNTRLICTAIGGIVKPCWIPGRTNCVDGKCASQPNEQCAATSDTGA